MMSTFEMWFPYRQGASGFELFSFPHAGAGSSVFNSLRETLYQSGVALSAAILPGHGRRLREAPHRCLDTLLTDFAGMAEQDGYSAFMGDYGLLGHCSGAVVAYEIAKLLVQAPCRDPQLLVVCSCLPPPLVGNTGISRLPTEELLAQTAMMGGTPQVLIENSEFLEVLERPLRADWILFDNYVYRESAKLSVPILAVRGTEDPDIQESDVQLWRDQTSKKFFMRDLECGHWALTEAGSSVLAQEIPAAIMAARDG
jgi:surfactin synthase thioesterase subunit